MTTLREGNLQITFPKGAKVGRLDDGAHGLSHCMKAVDFIIEEVDRISFIELEDPDHPNARQANIEDFLSAALDEDLKYEYRDTFLYQ